MTDGVPGDSQRESERLYLERFEALLDRLEALTVARRIKDAPHPTRDRLLEAVRWALGEDSPGPGFAPRQEGQGVFWWRPELRRRCGL